MSGDYFALFRAWRWPLLAFLCAAGMWTYANRVLIAHQVRDAAAHGRPRGNLSDLYPRWLGARELLLHGRDPYSPKSRAKLKRASSAARLIRTGPEIEITSRDSTILSMSPSFLRPPSIFRLRSCAKDSSGSCSGSRVATIPLWLRVLRWPAPLWVQAGLVVFTIGSLPVMQGLKLQQMTLLVAALLAIALALLVSDRPIAAGVVLALATIKPQLVWLLLLWLMIWTLADWRRRYRWAASFLLTMAILCAASEWYLPHWISRFWQAIREYRSYTGEMSVMDELIGAPWSRALEFLAFALMIGACWRDAGRRRTPTLLRARLASCWPPPSSLCPPTAPTIRCF